MITKHRSMNEIEVAIPWQSKNEKSLSIVYLKRFFNGKSAKFDWDFSVLLDESVFNNTYVFEGFSRGRGNVRLQIRLTAEHLKVNCSCGRMEATLCEHAYSLLREKVSKNKYYFVHLYDPKWFKP